VIISETLPDDICIGYNTCDSCRTSPSCGWCDDGSLTGLGSCLLGGASNPLRRRTLTHAHFDYVENEQECKRGDGMSWHFTSCPSMSRYIFAFLTTFNCQLFRLGCQCNGHSQCTKSRTVCVQPCDNFTEGDNCERCTKGYFGNAVNGGKCQGKAAIVMIILFSLAYLTPDQLFHSRTLTIRPRFARF
jgi:hypothetical protein